MPNPKHQSIKREREETSVARIATLKRVAKNRARTSGSSSARGCGQTRLGSGQSLPVNATARMCLDSAKLGGNENKFSLTNAVQCMRGGRNANSYH
jgi:hypothetical protein